MALYPNPMNRLRDMLRGPQTGPAAAFAMTQLAKANRIYQRSTRSGGGQGKGQGTIPLAITVSTAGSIYARIRSSDGSTILQSSWKVGTVTTGAQTLNVAGIDARLGWFYLDLSGDGSTWTTGTVLVGMGRLVGFAGQSLALRFVYMVSDATTIAAAGATINDNARIFAGVGPGSGVPGYQPTNATDIVWQQSSDGGNYTSAFAAQFLDWEVRSSGVNCGLIGHAAGQTASSTWVSGQPNNTYLLGVLAAVGGAFEAFMWMQGHSDSQGGVSYATYQANLTNIFGTISGANSWTGYKKYLASIPAINGTGWGTSAQIQTIRRASRDWALANGDGYIDAPDMNFSDGSTHQSQAGAIRLALHFYRATRPDLGLAGNHMGPLATGIVRATAPGGNTSLNMSVPSGATALTMPTGADLTYFMNQHLCLTGGGTDVWTMPAFAASGTSLLFADPAPEAALDFYLHYSNSPLGTPSTSTIYDNHIEPDEAAMGIAVGRPVTFVPDTITTASQGNFIYPAVSGGSFAYTTGSGGKFGEGVTSGYAIIANAPSYPNQTIEAWVKVPSNPSGLVVLFYGAIGNRWVGVNASGQLVWNIGGTTTTNATIADGGLHHVALVVSAGAGTIYIDGAVPSTGGTASAGAPQARGSGGGVGVRSLNGSNNQPASGVIIDEVANWKVAKYTGTFTPPASAYVGNEAGLVSLHHLDSTLTDACVN